MVMKAIIYFFKDLFSAPFQATLVISFSLVAALSIGIGALVISRTINDYLTVVMNERVARDIHLAETFYQLKLDQIEEIVHLISVDNGMQQNLVEMENGDVQKSEEIAKRIHELAASDLTEGNRFYGVFDANGNILAGCLVTQNNTIKLINYVGSWSDLEIIKKALQQNTSIKSTEVIPEELLASIGMDELIKIALIDTPKASATLYDKREGTAGLVLLSVIPIDDADGQIIGGAIGMHIFNNDFTLVDQIKDAAQIDTVTIFLGDLRVSTNVRTLEGERAVGTRVSQDVGDIVLYQGKEYVGKAFVVNEDYITRYEPILDSSQKIIGILYVGARQASFLRLLNAFDQRILVVTIFTIVLTLFLATPVSRVITRPLKELRELSKTSHQVALGDLSARAPITAGGEVGQLAISFNTMLDTLQETQDQLVHSEKLASLGQLAAGVAHELNNPLGTILLFSDILLKESVQNNLARNDLETIVKETKRCKSIVAALLDFARQHQVDVQEVNLSELIRNVVEIEKKNTRYAIMNIDIHIEDDIPIIQADPAQLEEVIDNLLQNAAEAMPEGGLISIRAYNGPMGMVTIEVQDTGTGIAEENMPKLFTPFFTTKPIGIGTGLGLAITYGIVKMHRGQISVQSKIGRGTTFTISLPIRLQVDENKKSFDHMDTSSKSNLIG
jgi:two-component system NtrC family sensor kinase